MDLFISTGEMSGDLHGAKLVQELLDQRPHLKIGAVAGPKMRKLKIREFFQMEQLLVMGFIDVLKALTKIVKQFFRIRNQILALNPKAVVCIDYPGFHLRLAKSLRKKGYRGKLIHYICPTVWAWGKKRIPLMAQTLDALLTIFPFEKKCFENTPLDVRYIGHPLVQDVAKFSPQKMWEGKILGIFPGSRKTEIDRNLPLQMKVARRLKEKDPSLQIYVSSTQYDLCIPDATIVSAEDNYELMRASYMAIATSGTVNLELALHKTPTVVNFAIKPLDCWIAQNIFRIDLPFYCIVNIILSRAVFPELFGPNLTEDSLYFWAEKLWFDKGARNRCEKGCEEVLKSLGMKSAAKEASDYLLSTIDF